MDAITHLLVGRLLAAPLEVELAILATVFAVLPDVDTIVWAFPRLRRFVRHRGWTHSLLFGAVASLAAGALFAGAGWSSFALAALVAFGAFLTHVLLDVLNWGCMLLWPARRARVEFTVHRDFRRSIPTSLAALVALELVRAWLPALHLAFAGLLGALLVGHFGLAVARRLRQAEGAAEATAARV